MRFLSLLIALLVFHAISFSYQEKKEFKIKIFDKEPVSFRPKTDFNNDSIIHLAQGRLLIKKTTLPEFKKETEILLNLTLKSAGDRWDKSGSCFIIPDDSPVNFLTVAEKSGPFPKSPPINGEYPGIVAGKGYKPALELLRFMTPFGVGAFSDSMELRKPVYIPHWEKEVSWREDITQFFPLLQKEVSIGIWIDTWTQEGYEVSLDLTFLESPYQEATAKKSKILSLMNTVYYMAPQKQAHSLFRQGVSTPFSIPEKAENIQLHYITTGHGGHSGGDEFTKQEHQLFIGENRIYSFIPWRDDCASFRRFNPGSGVWLIKDTAQYINWEKGEYETKPIEERLASSDLSRSNWCPGSKVSPLDIPLSIPPGEHVFMVKIPNAQEAEGDKLNHWLISAYITYDLKQ